MEDPPSAPAVDPPPVTAMLDPPPSPRGFPLATLVAVVPFIAIFLVPVIFRLIGSLIGVLLRSKTAGRRAHLVDIMEGDQRRYEKDKESGHGAPLSAVKTPTSMGLLGEETLGAQVGRDPGYDGFIGFFHPFW